MSRQVTDVGENASASSEASDPRADTNSIAIAKMPSNQQKRVAATGTAILFSVSLVFAILLAEVAARSYLVSPLTILPQYAKSLAVVATKQYVEPSTLPGIPYILRPNLDTLFKLVPLKTNSDGLRDKHYELAKPGGTFRVVVLGDSYTMPAGVSIEDAWHSRLEDHYNKQSNSTKYEFINFGLGGYRFNEYIATLEHRALRYQPNKVIVGLCPRNDLPMKWQVPRQDPYPVREAPDAYVRWYLEDLIQTVFPRKSTTHSDEYTPDLPPDQMWTEAQINRNSLNASFNKLKQIASKHQLSVTLVLLRRANEAQFQCTVFQDVCNKFGFELIDTGPGFSDAGRQWWIYPADGHPNAAANKIFADTILKQLKLSGT